MENKQSSSKKKLISIQKEKLIREIDYDLLTEDSTGLSQKELLLEIQQTVPNQCKTSQKVVVSIQPRSPTIKTIYLAEKDRFDNQKVLDKSLIRLAIGDHPSLASLTDSCRRKRYRIHQKKVKKRSTIHQHTENISVTSTCSVSNKISKGNVYNSKQKFVQKCYFCTQPQIIMNSPKVEETGDEPEENPKKVDISTLIASNTSSEDSTKSSSNVIDNLYKRIDKLERKILKQEMVFRAIDPNVYASSSDEDEGAMRNVVKRGRHRNNYVDQYSHVPETSAFHRYSTVPIPPPTSKSNNINREHNSEQYSRNFTTYDGITARTRRHSATVPGKRYDAPKMAAERVHKIRHKLNPVRDYRLMDTVHYLAQGEFAPRDDGIKLTPSREAVLSDIIWEDVCRTHWPNVRLAHRERNHYERYTTNGNGRSDLQRLIDSLLRERVAHVERRRRRHYRIIKLNHRHESVRASGKTGDIIVASHKNKKSNDKNNEANSDNNNGKASKKQKSPKSYDRLLLPVMREKPPPKQDECLPGPSYEPSRSRVKETTCCYRTSNVSARKKPILPKQKLQDESGQPSDSSFVSTKCSNTPKLVVKKDSLFLRKRNSREEPDLEHYILLPTLVVRTPSNLKRQKKFNELYHRILNIKSNKDEDCAVESEVAEARLKTNLEKKDIGFNINITLSNSEELINTL